MDEQQKHHHHHHHHHYDHHQKPRVVTVESEKSWDILVDEAKTQGTPLVVHFTASWCMPSVGMNLSFEELSLSYDDMSFLLVDVDEVKEVAAKMEIKAMPTFLIMKDGVTVDKLVGANRDEIKRRIDEFIHKHNLASM